jgi:uncharacterized membrane protein YtjA (UPF0391 family)
MAEIGIAIAALVAVFIGFIVVAAAAAGVLAVAVGLICYVVSRLIGRKKKC